MRNKFIHKGVSSIIGAIIAIAIVLSILTYLTLFGFGAFNAQQQSINYARSIELTRQMEDIIILYNKTERGNTLITIKNNGSIRVGIKSLIYRDSNDEDHILDLWLVALNSTQTRNAGIYLRNIKDGYIYNVTAFNGYIYLSPGGYMILEIEGTNKPVSVITTTGNVIKAPRLIEVSVSGNYTAVAGAVIVYPINIGTIADIANRSDISVDPDKLVPPTQDSSGIGMFSYYKHYVVTYNMSNVEIEASNFGFGNIVIGYDPTWVKDRNGPPRYNILITGPYYPGFNGNCMVIDGEEICPDRESPYGWRIKILGFTPDSSNSLYLRYDASDFGIDVSSYGADTLGIYYYANVYSDVVDSAYLNIRGHAEKVYIYYQQFGMKEYSYEPFLFSADIDGNGAPEWIFMTEDTNFGGRIGFLGRILEFYGLNDALSERDCCIASFDFCDYSNWQEIYDDWSVRPFYLNLSGYQVNGRDIAMVMVTIRLYFHDNAGSDIGEVDHGERTIFGVYLIDSETGEIVSSREYNYQELMNLEDTYPPNSNFFVETVPLIVPDNDRTYIVGLMFQDPYSNRGIDDSLDCGCDDVDFTLAIEWVGISLFARNQG